MSASDFLTFCEYFLNDTPTIELCDLNHQKNYFNAYNSFLVSRKTPIQDIKKHRMNSVIDYYMDCHNKNTESKDIYLELYNKNINDNFNKILNPPPCPFLLEERRKKQEEELQRKEDETDDIKDHYKFIENKYKYFADLVYRMNHPHEFDDDIQYNDYRVEENTESDNVSNVDEIYDDDYLDEESYDDFEEEYYSEDDYY